MHINKSATREAQLARQKKVRFLQQLGQEYNSELADAKRRVGAWHERSRSAIYPAARREE